MRTILQCVLSTSLNMDPTAPSSTKGYLAWPSYSYTEKMILSAQNEIRSTIHPVNYTGTSYSTSNCVMFVLIETEVYFAANWFVVI